MTITPEQLAEWARIEQEPVPLLIAEVERLRAIVYAAENLQAYRGNVREDEMWDKLDALLSQEVQPDANDGDYDGAD